jgi:lycopene cyclase domain-containing protein
MGSGQIFQTGNESMKYTYLLINFCTVIIPLIFSFHPKIRFTERWKHFFIANVPVSIFFILWDHWFTASGVWGFNSRYVTGINFFGLPFEEILFFICIPFACVFTYHCLTRFFNLEWNKRLTDVMITVLIIFLLTMGFIFRERLYTAITTFSASIIILLAYRINKKLISRTLSVYVILLIPFIIVNGILTGLITPEPVVWYDNDENSGIRLLTIPAEDIFYGMEMFVINIILFEWAGKRGEKTKTVTQVQ